jgi:energy-coupling factor transporter ATP-binding protein EcfA2
MTSPNLDDYTEALRRDFAQLPWDDIRPAAALFVGVALWLTPILWRASMPYKLIGAVAGLTLALKSDRTYSKCAEDRDRQRRRRQVVEEAQEDVIAAIAQSASAVNILHFERQVYDDLPAHMRPAYLLESAPAQTRSPISDDPFELLLRDAEASADRAEPVPTAIAAPAQSPPGSIPQFDEIDLALEAAQNDKSLLISGVSGAGKTTFLRHLIHAIDRVHGGSEMFVGIDFKGSTGHFCGLERSGSFVTSPAPGHDYRFAAAQVADVVDMLGSRTEEFPLYFLVDEINNGIDQAKSQPTAKGQRKPEEILRANLKFIATQGRERLIRGVFTAHGNLMGMLGIDGDTAQSLVCAVLGRKVEKGDGFALVGKVLKNQVWFDRDDRQRLSADFAAIRAIAERSGQAIALTNIRGDWELVLLPLAYKDDPGTLQAEPQNQSVTQLIRGRYDTQKAGAIAPDLDEKGQRFWAYISKREPHENEWFFNRIVADNWGRDNFQSTQEFKQFLASLITSGIIRSRDADLNQFALCGKNPD